MGKEKDEIQININKNTCRVCLSNNATNNIYCSKIFYNKMKVYCYEMMDDMLSMPAYSGDGLPRMICKKCLAILTAAYKLKLLAKESNRQLLLSLSSHSFEDTDGVTTISGDPLKTKEEVNTIPGNSLKSKEELKTISRKSLKNTEEVKTISSNSLKSKEDKIKEETTQQEYVDTIENEIKKEETKDWMDDDDDYRDNDVEAKEETDASRDGADVKQDCDEDGTRWSEEIPTKEEEAPSALPAPSRGVVKSTKKAVSTGNGKDHKKVKRKYCLKAKKRPYNCRLSSSLLCEECGLTFSCKNVAEHHRKLVHLKEKKYFCDYCNKGYLERPRLILHIKMHEGRKSFPCPNCGKMYYSRGGLSAHLVTERGVRSHSCPLCPKKFWNRMGLVNHGVTHTRERAFPCRYCPSTFSRKKNRKRHEVSMHQAVPTQEEMRFQKTQILVNNK